MRAAAVALAAVLCLSACSCPAPAPRSSSTGKEGRADAATRADQQRWVDDALKAGLLEKVKRGQRPEMHVGPRWSALTHAEKDRAAQAVAAWAFEVPRGGSLRAGEVLHIYQREKPIGTFSDLGLALD